MRLISKEMDADNSCPVSTESFSEAIEEHGKEIPFGD